MTIAVLWIIYTMKAPLWVWVIACLSVGVREANSLFDLIDKVKNSNNAKNAKSVEVIFK